MITAYPNSTGATVPPGGVDLDTIRSIRSRPDGRSLRTGLPPTPAERPAGSPLRVAIIGHLKFPIAEPFSGGLERFTHAYIQGLQARGIEVTLFASGDSDPSLGLEPILDRATIPAGNDRLPGPENEQARLDWIQRTEDDAYTGLMHRLQHGDLAGWFDVVHNHSINPIPLAYGDRLPCPMTTTLHVPVLPRLEEQLRSDRPRGSFVNISSANRSQWADLLPEQSVISNSVDVDAWTPQPQWRRPRAVWFGRVVPEKGPHHAIRAAHQAGLPIDVVGPLHDPEYLREHVEPALDRSRGDRLLGGCDFDELHTLVARAAVCFVTPCWEEPFGLVTAEAMACGTPVAAYDRGGPSEIVTPESGRLAEPGNIEQLAQAARECLSLDRAAVRRAAVDRYRESVMIDAYVDHYKTLVADHAADESADLAIPARATTPPKRVPDAATAATAATAVTAAIGVGSERHVALR